MTDPWGSFQNFMNSFNQFRMNPGPMLSRFGVQGNDPDMIIQQMMSSGMVNQQMYENARQNANMFRR